MGGGLKLPVQKDETDSSATSLFPSPLLTTRKYSKAMSQRWGWQQRWLAVALAVNLGLISLLFSTAARSCSLPWRSQAPVVASQGGVARALTPGASCPQAQVPPIPQLPCPHRPVWTPGSEGTEAVQRNRSMAVVLSRHDEDVSWVPLLRANLTKAPSNHSMRHMALRITTYQSAGLELVTKPEPWQLEAAEATAALAAAELAASGEDWQPGVRVRQEFTPMNRGREAMAYLSHIIANYHSLPDVTLFMHAHRNGNHTHLLPDWIIRRLVARPPEPGELPYGYMSLQCKEEPPDWGWFKLADLNATEPGFRQQHGANIIQAFEEGLGQWLGPLPTDLLTQPNAEFAATREAIQARPLEFYQAARHWLMTTSMRSYIAAMVFEYLWHLMISGQSVVWVPQEECLCRLYGVCLP